MTRDKTSRKTFQEMMKSLIGKISSFDDHGKELFLIYGYDEIYFDTIKIVHLYHPYFGIKDRIQFDSVEDLEKEFFGSE